MTAALLFGSAFLVSIGVLICGYAAVGWAADRRKLLASVLAYTIIVVASAWFGILVWLADGYYMTHKREGAYGHAWTPEPPPGVSIPQPGPHLPRNTK
jgi:F0F1-type ATP synthase membrane subunit c/vacuolar-type H+-ATPase subunit K